MAKRKYHTASGKNGSNRRPGQRDFPDDLVREDRDRAIFDVMRAIRGQSNKEAAAGACSPQTIRKWRIDVKRGGTRYPQHITMAAVLRAHGKRFTVGEM